MEGGGIPPGPGDLPGMPSDLDYGEPATITRLDDSLYELAFNAADAAEPAEEPTGKKESESGPTPSDPLGESQNRPDHQKPPEDPGPNRDPAQVPEPARQIDPHGRPLVAVCGTGGGVGTTTMTALLAYGAAVQGRGPVLLTDLGGPSATLAAMLGNTAPHSLGSAANAHRTNTLTDDSRQPFTTVEGVRLMARPPDGLDHIPTEADPALTELLIDAQGDHFATFVDCGRLDLAAERQVAGNATHLVWVTGETATRARQAEAKIEGLGFTGARLTALWIVNRSGTPVNTAVQRQFTEIQDSLGLSIIECGEIGDLTEQGLAATAGRALEPLKTLLVRILR